MGIGLAILGVPLALPLAVLTFFGAYFPIIGSVVTGGVAALVALAALGPVTALVVIGLTVLVHNIEGYLIGPLVLGRAVHLHPLAVLLALAAGGVIAGIVGAFLAVPVTAVAVTIFDYYREGDDAPIEYASPDYRPAGRCGAPGALVGVGVGSELHLAQGGEERRRPGVHVGASDHLAHAPHAGLAVIGDRASAHHESLPSSRRGRAGSPGSRCAAPARRRRTRSAPARRCRRCGTRRTPSRRGSCRRGVASRA